MPLADMLATLSVDDIEALKQPNFVFAAQQTFQAGIKVMLGEEHSAEGVPVLSDESGAYWIRFNHKATVGGVDLGEAEEPQTMEEGDEPDEAVSASQQAVNALINACAANVRGIALQPGDVLFVNNRRALHGRANVGGEPGGVSRWLLRSYGLDRTLLTHAQSAAAKGYRLFP
jgi:L-asparagine oxygenase